MGVVWVDVRVFIRSGERGWELGLGEVQQTRSNAFTILDCESVGPSSPNSLILICLTNNILYGGINTFNSAKINLYTKLKFLKISDLTLFNKNSFLTLSWQDQKKL